MASGATPHPLSGQRPKVPGCDGTGTGERSYPRLRPGMADGRSHLMPEARGISQEEQPQVQGAVVARAQEGLEELFYVQGQEGRQ